MDCLRFGPSARKGSDAPFSAQSRDRGSSAYTPLLKKQTRRRSMNWKPAESDCWRYKMQTHDEMIADWMKDPAFKAEYDALEDEFTLFDEVLKARKRVGLTQEQIAVRMGTKAPAVAR